MKRICITLLTIQLLFFGSSSTWAQSPIVPEEEIISTDSTGETQDIHIVVEQDQKVDTGGTADDIQQEQDSNINRSQDQSTPHEVESSEESEMIVNESTEKSEYSKQNVAPEFNQTYNQEQSVEVLAEQKQKVTQAEKVDAEQEQNVTLEYSQFLKVIQTGGQSQQTKIMTEQDQSVTTDDDADYVEQMVETIINTKQEGAINLVENSNKGKQQSVVTTIQQHKAETSGDAMIQQEQGVESTATNQDTVSENLSIKARASNGVKIIRETMKTIVSVVQLIFIDDSKVEEFNKEFIIGEDPIQQSQEYSQNFAWGTLYVLNHTLVNKTEDNDISSLLDSIIRLEFFLPENKSVEEDNKEDSDGDSGSKEEDSVENDPHDPGSDGDGRSKEEDSIENDLQNPGTDGNGKSNEEEYLVGQEPQKQDNNGKRGSKVVEKPLKTIPSNPYLDGVGLVNVEKESLDKNLYYRDTDGDGVSDYLEEKKFYTNPLKADTDEDGLTDYFEIVYHSSTSFNFSLESMDYDPAPLLKDIEENWMIEPEKLNPLNKDSDYDGTTDDHENFDQDELDHEQEQFYETNPYKKDDLSILRGNGGMVRDH